MQILACVVVACLENIGSQRLADRARDRFKKFASDGRREVFLRDDQGALGSAIARRLKGCMMEQGRVRWLEERALQLCRLQPAVHVGAPVWYRMPLGRR